MKPSKPHSAKERADINAVRTLESAHTIDATFREWLVARDRVLCGYTAINAVLPSELKFFTDHALPDYEVLTPDAQGDVADLVAVLLRQGSRPQAVTDPDTGSKRVFANSILLARFTEVPTVAYRRLRTTALIGDTGTPIAPIDYLRMTVLFEMSRQVEADAWNESFDRLLRLNRAFGVGASTPSSQCEIDAAPELNIDATKLLKATRQMLMRPGAKEVLCGYVVAAMALDTGSKLPTTHARMDRQSTCMDILSADPNATADALVAAFTGVKPDEVANTKKSGHTPPNTHVVNPRRIKRTATKGTTVYPRSVTISLDGRPLIGVIHADRCVAFVKVDGIRVATLDTLLALYLRAFIMGRPTTNVRCMCDLLATLEYKQFDSVKPLFTRYVTECYGANDLPSSAS